MADAFAPAASSAELDQRLYCNPAAARGRWRRRWHKATCVGRRRLRRCNRRRPSSRRQPSLFVALLNHDGRHPQVTIIRFAQQVERRAVRQRKSASTSSKSCSSSSARASAEDWTMCRSNDPPPPQNCRCVRSMSAGSCSRVEHAGCRSAGGDPLRLARAVVSRRSPTTDKLSR